MFKAEGYLFFESLHQSLGHCTMVGDLVKLSLEDTSQYDPYEEKKVEG